MAPLNTTTRKGNAVSFNEQTWIYFLFMHTDALDQTTEQYQKINN